MRAPVFNEVKKMSFRRTRKKITDIMTAPTSLLSSKRVLLEDFHIRTGLIDRNIKNTPWQF